MDEIQEIRKRLEIAEKEIEVLKETFSTLQNMNMSEQMRTYISRQQNVLSVVSLINSVSDDEQIDMDVQKSVLEDVKRDKQEIDEQISRAVNKSADFSGYSDDYAKYFEYQPYKDGIEITAYIGFDNKEIIVPNKIDGLPVVRIGDEVFLNSPLEKVILPETLRELCPKTFKGCISLKNINLPKSLLKIGYMCFAGSGLTEVYINVETIPHSCFNNCNLLHNVTIGEKVKEIGELAFENIPIKHIIIPENVLNISDCAFRMHHSLDIAFCGMKTNFDGNPFWASSNRIFYCLPGSDAQKYARQRNISVKPLSEFPKSCEDISEMKPKPLSEFPKDCGNMSKLKPDDFVNEDRWQDILDKFSEICPMVNSALDGSYAYRGGGYMLIYTPNSFFLQLLRNKENAAKLQEAIRIVTGEMYSIRAKCIEKSDNDGIDKRRL